MTSRHQQQDFVTSYVPPCWSVPPLPCRAAAENDDPSCVLGTTNTNLVTTVRSKWQLMPSPEKESDRICRTSDPLDVKIAGARGGGGDGDGDLYLTVDHQKKPVMRSFHDRQQLEQEAAWVWMKYQSDRDGQVCTLLHKASCRLLAVEDKTDQPTTVHRPPLVPVCTSPKTDIPLRRRSGTEPVGDQEPECFVLQRCCLFKIPHKTVRSCLVPVGCGSKSLTYDDSGVVRPVSHVCEDFVLHEVTVTDESGCGCVKGIRNEQRGSDATENSADTVAKRTTLKQPLVT